MSNRRGSWVALPLVVACAVSACGSGMSAADATKKAKEVRASTAKEYWKIRDSLPGSLDEPSGQGAFVKCAKTSDAVTYSVEDYLQPMSGKPTMKQLLSDIEGALGPQGWKFASEGQLPKADQSDNLDEKLYGYIAKQDGTTVHLTLHEAKRTDPAAGYLNVSSACQKYGKAQKDLLAKYTGGGGRDNYQQSTTSPDPIPTGFPTPGL